MQIKHGFYLVVILMELNQFLQYCIYKIGYLLYLHYLVLLVIKDLKAGAIFGADAGL